MKETLVFELERETKNTYRFQEKSGNGRPPIIGTLYVQKWAFKERPSTVTVTIETQ